MGIIKNKSSNILMLIIFIFSSNIIFGFSQNVVNYKVRILASEKGQLYLGDKKILNIVGGIESSFIVKKGEVVLTLDADSVIYRKVMTITEGDILINFTKDDVFKFKKTAPKIENKVNIPITTKKETVDKITNEYLIDEIVNPLKDNSVYEVVGKCNYYKLREAEDDPDDVLAVDKNGIEHKLKRTEIREIRDELGRGSILDNYYIVENSINFKLKKEYIDKVEKILKKISREEINDVGLNSNWNKSNNRKYIIFSEKSNLENKLLDKVYRLSSKTSKKYEIFFQELDSVLKKQKEFQIRLYKDKIFKVGYGIKINNSYYGNGLNLLNLDNLYHSEFLKANKEIKGSDESILTLITTPFRSGEYYFIRGASPELVVKFIQKQDFSGINAIKVSNK